MTETNNNTNTNTNNTYDKDITTNIVVSCQNLMMIETLNCRIFRHDTYINTNAQTTLQRFGEK
jgi:hypothetical protein